MQPKPSADLTLFSVSALTGAQFFFDSTSSVIPPLRSRPHPRLIVTFCQVLFDLCFIVIARRIATPAGDWNVDLYRESGSYGICRLKGFLSMRVFYPLLLLLYAIDLLVQYIRL
jgi:hypothetical protein